MFEPVRWKEQREWTPPIYVVEVIHKDDIRNEHKFYDPDKAFSFAKKLCDDKTVCLCRLMPSNVKLVPIGFHVVGNGMEVHLERSIWN